MAALGGFDSEEAIDLDNDDSADIEKMVTAAAAPPLMYGSANEFFREHLRHIYKRRINGNHRKWDPDWWMVPEAVVRMTALWRSWEAHRQVPSTGISVWMLDHLDRHMAVLTDPDGPFATSEAVNKAGEALPHNEPPEELFPDEREPF
ncbi:DUF4913 domain-containing protein [Leucobacter sp. UCMA 4100]|uniref:DUF4913 domain-containing protein n=1 Tax=Leucobacter sp. UCMA 4100 TaxID=2810534 RepID=UPI0022EAAAE6|nr:DUF4913 domain-containing protein [Leucobacter sp. UCMA 4100]MDA3145772.1 DUF4913 domain-containing protein [Leucobacter sp. UCMA 4100]